MKKYLLLATIALGFSVSLFAKEPVITYHMQNGHIVETALMNRPYIGFRDVKQTYEGGLFSKKRIVVKCSDPGEMPCRVTFNDGSTITISVSDANEKNSYDFDAPVIMREANKLADFLEEKILKTEKEETISKTIALYDSKGIQRFVAIKCTVALDKSLNGTISTYLDVIN